MFTRPKSNWEGSCWARRRSFRFAGFIVLRDLTRYLKLLINLLFGFQVLTAHLQATLQGCLTTTIHQQLETSTAECLNLWKLCLPDSPFDGNCWLQLQVAFVGGFGKTLRRVEKLWEVSLTHTWVESNPRTRSNSSSEAFQLHLTCIYFTVCRGTEWTLVPPWKGVCQRRRGAGRNPQLLWRPASHTD